MPGARVAASSTWFDPDVFFPAIAGADDGPVVWIGRFEAPKDPMLALDVATALQTGGHAVPMRMIGQGSLAEAVSEELKTRGLTNVTLQGPTDAAGVAEAMRGARCLLLTSHFEGSPRVLFEALGCGVPVVATSEADPGNVLGAGGGITVADRQAAALASAVVTGLPQRSAALDTAAAFAAPAVLARLVDWIGSGDRRPLV